eukprot:c5620_g1_i2.p1 GENE.c5620_g1_i2~~c5620_g1_i2.p1  ORF type:complete len:172 (+),score=55.95 c5620_g1_i2:137-652(+)
MNGCTVLNRLRAFLPQFAEANNKLQHDIAIHGAQSVNIENTEDDDNVIEMDMLVGVLEAKATAPLDASQVLSNTLSQKSKRRKSKKKQLVTPVEAENEKPSLLSTRKRKESEEKSSGHLIDASDNGDDEHDGDEDEDEDTVAASQHLLEFMADACQHPPQQTTEKPLIEEM